MRTIEQIREELEAKRNELKSVELDPDDYTDEYDEMLREVYGEVNIAGISLDADQV